MVDIYREMVVGGVQAVPGNTWAQYYPTIADIVGPVAMPSAVASPSAFFNDLQALRKSGASMEALQNAARTAITKGALFTDASQLAASFQDIDKITALLNASRLDEATAALRAAAPNWSTLQGKAIQVHDSMLANLVLNQNHRVVEIAQQFLKVFWLFKALGGSQGPRGAEVVAGPPLEDAARSLPDFIKRFWDIGRVSIPLQLPAPQQGAWPTAGYLAQALETPAPSDKATVQDLSAELNLLKAAKRELAQRYEAQLTAQKNAKVPQADFISQLQMATGPVSGTVDAAARFAGPAIEIDWNAEYARYTATIGPNILAADSYTGLSAPTKTTLATLGYTGQNLDVPGALSAIDARNAALNSIWTSYDLVWASAPVVWFGGFLVEAHPSVFADIICGEPKKQCHCDLLKKLAEKHGEKPQVRVLGTGRAYVVRQELKRYVRGALVHTEPVLGKTKRSTSFRELDRVEDVQEIATTLETFEERSTTTDDQFAFATEVATQTQEQHQQEYGLSVSATYGPVSASGHYGASSTSAASQTARTATSNAKEVIDKAVKRIQEKTETRRKITRTTEKERNTGFEINNEGPSFTGFYYAIDKEYTNQLVFVGERLMFRVAIQQPMAFLIHCMSTMQSETITLEKPIPPSQLSDPVLGSLKSFHDINVGNYAVWASLYDAQGIKSPPSDIVVSSAVFVDYVSGMKSWIAQKGAITIPTGYKAKRAYVNYQFSMGSGRYIHGFVGNGYFMTSVVGSKTLELDGEQGDLAFTYRGHVEEFAINYVILCTPTVAAMDAWGLDTYNAIMDGYNKKKSEYDNQVSMAGITIQGRDPLKNKMLIEQELQKLVLGALYPPFYYRGFDSMKFGYPCDATGVPISGALPIPEPDFKDANEELPWVSFFLQLCEWHNMTYKFLPYHFGNRRDWCVLRKLEDVDPFFENAITAGYVVVDIPVAPQMTEAFLHFYETQQIWNGGEMPMIGDKMFQEIAIAIRDSENMADDQPVGKPWTTLVPTSLVYIQDTVPDELWPQKQL